MAKLFTLQRVAHLVLLIIMTNSHAEELNSIAKVTNFIVNRTNSIAKATNSIE